jgi:hypothetical protein
VPTSSLQSLTDQVCDLTRCVVKLTGEVQKQQATTTALMEQHTKASTDLTRSLVAAQEAARGGANQATELAVLRKEVEHLREVIAYKRGFSCTVC